MQKPMYDFSNNRFWSFSFTQWCRKVVKPWDGLWVRTLYTEGCSVFEKIQTNFLGTIGVIIDKVYIFSQSCSPLSYANGIWNLHIQILVVAMFMPILFLRYVIYIYLVVLRLINTRKCSYFCCFGSSIWWAYWNCRLMINLQRNHLA